MKRFGERVYCRYFSPPDRIERAECPKIPVMVLSTNGGKAFDIANFYVSYRSQFATTASGKSVADNRSAGHPPS